MKILSKRIVADRTGRPAVVQVDYDEFLRLSKEAKVIEPQNAYERMLELAGTVDFGGEDGLEYQRRLRAEWD